MDLISVIVPVYNVEEYLEECLDSLLKQIFENYEVLLINDGSTDNSQLICEKYVQSDKRFHLFNKENGGLSDARNYGIEKAKGNLITFIDSDDYVEKEYLQELLNNLKKNNSDISIVAHRRIDETHHISYEMTLGKNMTLNNKEALKNMFYQKNISIAAWGKLYKISLFDNIKYRKNALYEDILTTPLLFEKADIISYSSKVLLNYRIRKNSITESQFSENTFHMLNNAITISYHFKYDKQIYTACQSYIFSKAAKIFYLISIQSDQNIFIEEKENCWKQLKRTRNKNLFNSNTRFMNKIAAIATFFGKKVFIRMFRLKER